MKHVMLDIETMSRRPNAAIVSIGAVPFNSAGQIAAPVSLFYHTIHLKSCEQAGLHIGAETVDWWMHQDTKARLELHMNCQEIGLVLDRFTLFLEDIKKKESCEPFIWGRGPGFDNVILREAYRTMGKPCPWNFRKDRCMRTLELIYAAQGHSVSDVHRELENMEDRVEHHALHDAMFQAGVTSLMLKDLEVSI